MICSTLKSTVALVVGTFLATVTWGQDSEFAFDLNGNLVSQTVDGFDLPQILSQPQSQVAGPGALASFFVVTANNRDLSYQWRFNGANLGGATNDTLFLKNIGVTNEGQYSVVLVNSSGSVTSAPAALLLDGDGDGLADSWELSNFSNLNQRSTGDFDGDGVSNLDEFLEGTNPADGASLRFRLTVQSSGGSVSVVPSRSSYTNGEVVTLTATAFAPEVFRGWTGDINSTNNPLTFTITNHVTLLAHLGSYDIIWANTGNGDWNVASNWSPPFVPTTNDNVVIARTVTVTVNSPAQCGSLTLGTSAAGPTITGNGTLTVHRDSIWINGHMTGTGRTVINPGATLVMANALGANLTTRTLENGGTFVWTGAGSINLGSTAVITNRAGALFETRSVGGFAFGGGANSRFDNAGTFRKSIHTGTTSVNNLIAFNNFGTVEIQTGTLALAGGGTHTGSFDVSAGATLNIGGTHNGSAASSITGAGNFTVNGGTTTLAGLVNVSGTHLFDNGTAHLNGNYICTNILTIAGGTANFNGAGAVTPSVLNLITGTLGGSGVVTVLDQLIWTGGTMTGTGRTIISTGITLNLANSVILNGRTLENRGSFLWTSGNFDFGGGAVFTNRTGALFEAKGTGGLGHIGGANARFDNAGTFRKSANSGTSTFDNLISFNNYGAVEIQTGTLFLDGGGTHTGSFEVSAGTTLNLAGGTHNASTASSITGAGNFTVDGATATLAGLIQVGGNYLFDSGTANLNGNFICTNNTLTIAGGTANFNGTGTVTPTLLNLSSGTLGGSQVVTVLNQMNWTGGTMISNGRTVIPVGVVLNVASAGGVILNTRTLENGGTVSWTAGNINMTGSIFTNRSGAFVEVTGAVGFGHIGGLNGRFDNAGTFRKSVNVGTTTADDQINFNNYGAVEIQAGTLLLDGGGLNNGTINVPAGTTLDLSGGTFTGSAGSSITGDGQFRCSGGTANLAGLVNLRGTHSFTSGTANLTGNYICTNNTMTISGGTANFNGTGTVTPTTVNLSSGNLGGGQTVTILGAMNWTGGTMTGSGRTIIPAGATLNLATVNGVNLSGGRTLENGGTVLWTSGSIGMAIGIITNRAGALFENRNAGAINWNGGNSRIDNAGAFRKTVSTGTLTINSGISLNNYGTLEIQNGILSASGGYTCTSGSLLNCALGGTTVGTGYGRLQAAGTVTLNGALNVTLANGFIPSTNDSFTVLTAGARNGAFATFNYPSNAITMQMSNTVNSVIVRTIDVLEIPQPILLSPEFSGSDIRLIWTSVSNTTYQLEFNPDLNPSNWIALPGAVLSLSNTASKLDALTSSNRFYRVRVAP